MTARARTLTPGLVSALSPTATGSPAAGATGSTGPSSTPTGGPARVVVDLDLPGSTISRHLYGHFAEHLGRCIYEGFFVGEDSEIPNTRGIRDDVVAALRALQIPNLRWPGGCFADDYHWKDGIGPREQRPRMVNSHWGDIVEDNSFGTHEFMDLVELLGTEAYVNGNVGSGTVARDERVDRVPHPRRRLAHGVPAPRERTRRALEGALLRHRQRGLGLRREHAGRRLRGAGPPVLHLRARSRRQRGHPDRGRRER